MKPPCCKPLRWIAPAWATALAGPGAQYVLARPVDGARAELVGALAGDDRLPWLAAIVLQGVAAAAAVTVFILYRRSAAREAAAAGRMRSLLEQADCLLWEAAVSVSSQRMDWVFRAQPSGLYRRLLGNRPITEQRGLWEELDVPERAEMDARALQAMRTGVAGYEQEFRIIQQRATVWLRESVSITPAGPNRWKLIGVVTDITPLRAAQDARLASERELQQILGQTACVLWRATVVRDGDEIRWLRFVVPNSGLSGELFGNLPELAEGRFWDRYEVPAQRENNARSRQAILSGAPGYEQEFRVLREGREWWLHERVSIKAVGAEEWHLAGVITDVTDRHRAEEARKASEAQVERLLGAADCMVWQATAQKRPDGALAWIAFAPASQLYRDVFGGDPVPELALPWSRVVTPATLARMDEVAAQALETGASAYQQDFHAQRAGRGFWLHEQVTITTAEPGHWSLVGVTTDITARRTAEEAVRVSEARFRELLEHAPVAILQADLSELSAWLEKLHPQQAGDLAAYLEAHPEEVLRALAQVRLIDVNDVTLRLFRARSKEHLQARRRRLFGRGSVPALRGALLALAHGRNTFEAETCLRDLTGSVRQIHLRWWLAKREQGLDLSKVIVVLVDLTNLKRAEAELATEKERLAVTLRAMAEAVITTDIGGAVQFINPAAAQFLHQPLETAVGRPLAEICMLEEEASGVAVTLPVARVARGDAVVDLPPRTRLVAPPGAPRLIEGCCAPIHAADSSVVGTVLVLRDVTERERLEEELVRASKLESVGLLAGGIAHDFNNILTVVLGNLTLALLDADAAGKTARVLRSAEQAVLRARDLTQQLLTFARGGDPIRTAVRLPHVIADAVQFSLHGSRVRSELEIVPDLWAADADKAQIGRVVQNLVLNAVQAMPAGGIVRIAAGNERLRDLGHPALRPGDYVRISVTDQGAGIKPEHLARVFEPYFTLKQPGGGFALATVYSIVRKHKGHVEVESAVGRGATFHVWLPALRGNSGAGPEEAAPVDLVQRLNARVLFMDDEPPIREMATDILGWLGCEVELAADGQEAVNLFRMARAQGRPFDVVVMDLTIPGGMGGLETLELLRTMDKNVKVIVSSGYSSDPILANHRQYGFRGRVAKPYDVTEFSRVLREVLAAGTPAS